jgi:hypothetical protein
MALNDDSDELVDERKVDQSALGTSGAIWGARVCAYVTSLGGAGVYVSGIIAAIDLFSMLGLFFGLRPELMISREREIQKQDEESSKKELPPSSEPG